MKKQEEPLSFGATLLKIRKAKNKTQRDVARAIEMDFSYFSRLENDRFDSKPTRETIDKIATALECTAIEREELLAAAGRIDEELERATQKAAHNPVLRELFRASSNLPNSKIQQLLDQIKEDKKK